MLAFLEDYGGWLFLGQTIGQGLGSIYYNSSLLRAMLDLSFCYILRSRSFLTYKYSYRFWINSFSKSFCLLGSSYQESLIILICCFWLSNSRSTFRQRKYFQNSLDSERELTMWQFANKAKSHLCRCSSETNLRKTLVRFLRYSSMNSQKRSTNTLPLQQSAYLRLPSSNYCSEDFYLRNSEILSNLSYTSYVEYYSRSQLSEGKLNRPTNPSRCSDSLKQLVLLDCCAFYRVAFSCSNWLIESFRFTMVCSRATFSCLNLTTSSSKLNSSLPSYFLPKSGLQLESMTLISSLCMPMSGRGGLCELDVWSCFELFNIYLM